VTDATRRLAAALRVRGLGVPARLLIDAHRPLTPLLDDLGVAAAPLLRLAGGPARELGDAISEPGALDRLGQALDRDDADAHPG
jgi:hypothetical protein